MYFFLTKLLKQRAIGLLVFPVIWNVWRISFGCVKIFQLLSRSLDFQSVGRAALLECLSHVSYFFHFLSNTKEVLPKRSLLLSFFWFSLDFLWSPLHFSGLPHAHQSFRDFLVPRSLSPTKILPKDSLLILCFFLWKAREPSETFWRVCRNAELFDKLSLAKPALDKQEKFSKFAVYLCKSCVCPFPAKDSHRLRSSSIFLLQFGQSLAIFLAT